MTEGMEMMQNAFLTKQTERAEESAPAVELMQTKSSPEEQLDGVSSQLKDIFQTKFVIHGSEWTVWDWTIFVIIIAIVIVASLVAFLFCCLIGSDRETDEREAREKAEMEQTDKKNTDYKKDEPQLVASIGAGDSFKDPKEAAPA
uniref:Uncharacterized protein n=1 Tax=Strombidium rassoulzadegani TaxID=1082188 RepID=A0A7S3FUB3_9SPIT|mmetsp:Transcript_16698/g.28397  ORF Transcript_16698/g.28397 Transcript_16698/m.28397 type:complete len:145 (+) Transcript_16698:172-606(+)